MAFEDINTVSRQHSVRRVDVALALYMRKREPKNAPACTVPTLELIFSESILERMGLEPGKSRLLLAEGTGADHGIIELRPAPEGSSEGVAISLRSQKDKVGTMRIDCAHLKHHKFKSEMQPARGAQYQLFGSRLGVMLVDVLAD